MEITWLKWSWHYQVARHLNGFELSDSLTTLSNCIDTLKIHLDLISRIKIFMRIEAIQ